MCLVISLEVKNTGYTTLSGNQHNLKLNNILHAPAVTKNLISVSRFIADNDVIIEFNSSGCFVKDKQTGTILLKGTQKDGLYEFENAKHHSPQVLTQDFNSNSSVFLVSKSIKKLWHLRLGHPYERVLKHVLRLCNVKLKKMKITFVSHVSMAKTVLFHFNCPVLELLHLLI